MNRLSGLLLLFILLSGCATVISEESRKMVDTTVQFAALKESPHNYIGKNIMVGGRIIGAKNTKEGAVVEIMQLDLTANGYPDSATQSTGRFLATSIEFLETSLFKRGRLITLVGEIKGRKIIPLDDIEYSYPVIAIREYYLWKDPDYDKDLFYPMLPYYSPEHSGSAADPYWTRPTEPTIKRWN